MRNRHGQPYFLSGLVLLVMTLAGCTRGLSDLNQWVVAEKAKKGPPLDPLPVLKTFETFTYDERDLRDPFSPSKKDKEEESAVNVNGPHPDPNRTKEPLEAYTLDSLKMVGTIGIGPAMEGLLKDPDNVIHRVRIHDYLGQNDGHITAVDQHHIELVELIKNDAGGWMERQASIALGDK